MDQPRCWGKPATHNHTATKPAFCAAICCQKGATSLGLNKAVDHRVAAQYENSRLQDNID